MPKPFFILIGTQCLFTLSDLIGRTYMARYGFRLATFFSLWFLVYLFLRQVATFGQLYVFSHVHLGKTMALFGVVSIVLSNLLGFLYLGERMSFPSYLGVCLALFAFIAMALR